MNIFKKIYRFDLFRRIIRNIINGQIPSSSHYWFGTEMGYLSGKGFNFKGNILSKIGYYTKGNIKIYKIAYFEFGEQYFYLLRINNVISKRYDFFTDLKDELEFI